MPSAAPPAAAPLRAQREPLRFELLIKTSTATHHLAALRWAGILHQYYAGTSRMKALRLEHMEFALPRFLTAVIAAAKRGSRTSTSHGAFTPH